MSLTFETKPVATITAKSATSADTFTLKGCTTASTTPDNAAAQINKLFGIVGKSVAAAGMTRSITEEALDNG